MEVYDIAIIPLITGLVELAKRLGVPKEFAPALSVILGIIIGIVYVAPTNPAEGVLVGIALGLSAVGLYSGSKNTVESIKE